MLASVAVVVATLFGSPATALAEPIFGGFGGSRSATLEMKVHHCHAWCVLFCIAQAAAWCQ
jgi:hypothetical protein